MLIAPLKIIKHKMDTYTSSIVDEVRQDNFKPVYFFNENILPLLFFISLFLFCWLVLVWFAFSCAKNVFVKKNKVAWNCLDDLIYYTTYTS